MSDELSQWCAIDGHQWTTHYLEYGLMLGPKQVDITKVCQNCLATEHMVWKPIEVQSRHWFTIWPPFL